MSKDVARDVIMFELSGLEIGHSPDAATNLTEENGVQKLKNVQFNTNLIDGNEKRIKEYVDTGWRYPTQLLHFQRDCLTSNLHPTQKPIALLEYLIRTYTNEGDTVLDACMGSGSTGVACINTNRNFVRELRCL